MGTTSKQVMDIKTSKGLSQTSNEELRAWTDKGWEQAMREGNYDRSREHLNFEIQKGGIVTPIDKKRPLTKRMAENGLWSTSYSEAQPTVCVSWLSAIRKLTLRAKEVTGMYGVCRK